LLAHFLSAPIYILVQHRTNQTKTLPIHVHAPAPAKGSPVRVALPNGAEKLKNALPTNIFVKKEEGEKN
jgi:hypothetical protein